MTRIYFAGPLFCFAEKEYNRRVVAVLERAGYDVFFPQRDGFEACLLEGKDEAEKTELIFQKDVSEVKRADVLFMVLDGRVPDEGACVELGVAYALGKRCYGIRTDARAIERDMDLNPLLAGCFRTVFCDLDGERVLDRLEAYLKDHSL